MKLACLSETKAPPIRNPRRPTRSISSPADSSPGIGLTNTDPAFCPPGWFSRRHRTISAISRSDRSTSPSASCRCANSTISWSSRLDPRNLRPSDSAGRHAALLGAQIEDVGPHDARGDVGAVPAGVHPAPLRRSSRARRPPIRTRSVRRRPCGGPAPAARRPSRSTHRCPATSMPSANSARLMATPANPASATSRLEPRPTTSTGRS